MDLRHGSHDSVVFSANIQTKGDLTLLLTPHSAHIGSNVKIHSGGSIIIDANNFNLNHKENELFAKKHITIETRGSQGSGNISIGYSPETQRRVLNIHGTSLGYEDYGQFACGDSNYYDRYLTAKARILAWEDIILRSHHAGIKNTFGMIHSFLGNLKLESPSTIENLAGSIKAKKDIVIRSNHFKNYRTEPASIYFACSKWENKFWGTKDYRNVVTKAQTSDPALLYAGRDVLIEAPEVENIGSAISAGKNIMHKYGSKTETITAKGGTRFHNRSQPTCDDSGAAISSAGKQLEITAERIENTGVLASHAIDLKFKELTVGRGAIVSTPTKAELAFQPVHELLPRLDPYGLYRTDGIEKQTYLFSALVPMPDVNAALPVVMTPQGLSRPEPGHRFALPPYGEIELLQKTLLSSFHLGHVPGFTDLEGSYRFLRKAADNLYGRFYGQPMDNELAAALVTVDRSVATIRSSYVAEPMLIYREVFYGDEMVYTPVLLFPTAYDALTETARGHEGVIHGPQTPSLPTTQALLTLPDEEQEEYGQIPLNVPSSIHLNGERMDIFGTIEADLLDTTVNDIYLTRPQYEHLVEYCDTYKKRSWFGLSRSKKTICHSVLLYESQPGGQMIGREKQTLLADTLHSKGGTIQGGTTQGDQNNLEIQARKEIQATPLYNTHLKETSSWDFNLFSSKEAIVHHVHTTIIPPLFSSKHTLQGWSDDLLYSEAGQFHATHLAYLKGKNIYLLGARATNTEGPFYESEGLKIKETTYTHETALPTLITGMQQGVIIEAHDHLEGVGPQVISDQGNIQITAGNLLFQPLIWLEKTYTKTEGLDWFTYISQKESLDQQEATYPLLKAPQGAMKITATAGDMTLIGPRILAEQLKMAALRRNIHLLPGVLTHSHTLKGKTVGLSFFGSEVVSSLFQKEPKDALKALARSFTPMFDAYESLLKSRDTADVAGNAIHSLYETYKTLTGIATHKDGLKGFLQDRVNLDPGIEFTTYKQNTHWTTLVLPWLMARHVRLLAEDGTLGLQGIQGEGKTFAAHAQDIELTAGEETSRSSFKQNSFKISAKTDGMDPSSINGVNLAFGWQRANEQARRFVNAHLKYQDSVLLNSDDTLALKGAVIETMKAFVDAKALTMESLQDTRTAESYGGQVGVTFTPSMILPSFSLHDSDADEAWVRRLTGFHAKEFWATIKEKTELLGSVLEADQGKLTTPVLLFTDREDHRHAVASSVWTTDELFSGKSAIYGLLDLDYRDDEAQQINRATVSPAIHIDTTSDLTHLNRDLQRAQELVRDDHTHVRLTVPVGWDKDKLRQDVDAITAYFRQLQPLLAESAHQQIDALVEMNEALAKDGAGEDERWEILQDAKVAQLVQDAHTLTRDIRAAVQGAKAEQIAEGDEGIDSKALAYLLKAFPEPEDAGLSRPFLADPRVYLGTSPEALRRHQVAFVVEATQQRTLAQRSLDLLVRYDHYVNEAALHNPRVATFLRRSFEELGASLEKMSYGAACWQGASLGATGGLALGPAGSGLAALGGCIACMLSTKAVQEMSTLSLEALKDKISQWAGRQATSEPEAKAYSQASRSFIDTATLASIGKKGKKGAKGSNATQIRNTPGVVTASRTLPTITGQWLRGTHANAARVPRQVADKLQGKTFKNFAHFRREFWKTIANDPILRKGFKEKDLKAMKSRGTAPVAHLSQWDGQNEYYNLHHVKPIHDGGGVYDLDNIVVVTPRYHKEILEPRYHKNTGKKND